MYIEVFLLDNAVMDFLTLRTAQAALGRKAPMWKLIVAAMLGAAYSLAALWIPALSGLSLKLLSGGLMAFAFSPRDIWSFLRAVLCVFMAALVTGGAVTALSYAFDGGINAGRVLVGLELRTALYGAAAATMLPRLVRKVFSRRIQSEGMRVKLIIAHDGKKYELDALIDTGNSLTEPLFALPAAIIYAPELTEYASLPIPYCTISGTGELMGFIPDCIAVCPANNSGSAERIPAIVALSPMPIENADALLPIAALPY